MTWRIETPPDGARRNWVKEAYMNSKPGYEETEHEKAQRWLYEEGYQLRPTNWRGAVSAVLGVIYKILLMLFFTAACAGLGWLLGGLFK